MLPMAAGVRPGDTVRLNEVWGAGRRPPELAGVFMTVTDATSDGDVVAVRLGQTHVLASGSYKVVLRQA
jgi:hypothetical protein